MVEQHHRSRTCYYSFQISFLAMCVCERIDFKILLLLYEAQNGLEPSTSLNCCCVTDPSGPLRSCGTGLVTGLRVKTTC